MKELITAIFTEHNFKIINMPTINKTESFYAISMEEQKVNYYLVLFIDNLTDIEKNNLNLNYYYEEIKALKDNYDKQMDKNLTMLICAKRENLEVNQKLSQVIYRIEEDPYFFKKYVLTYTDKQVNLINSDIPSYDAITNYLYSILNNHDLFVQFKSDPYKETKYSLVSKIFIKLPFLNLQNVHTKIANLKENINVSLNRDQTELRNKALESAFVFEQNDDNLRDKILSFIGVDQNE